MGMRSKQSPRCIRCRMHESQCLCPWLPQYDLSTRVVLIIHHKERAKPSATGPLALECLANSEQRVHGRQNCPLDLHDLLAPERRPLFLFPREGAEDLTPALLARDTRPVTLIVPDGNWRQASTMARRLPALDAAEGVTLPPGQQTRWGLRHENREEGLATFEAIARALGIIESRTVQSGMEALFQLMVDKTLQARGTR